MKHLNEHGVSLVEVMLSMTMLLLVLSSLAGASLQVARQSIRNTDSTYQGAAVWTQMDRFSVLPYDSLASRVGCTDLTTTDFPHTRCVSINQVSATEIDVQIVIAPADTRVKPDTVRVTRSRPARANPFS